MKSLTLNQAKKATKKIADNFNSKSWTIHNRLAELIEEVGELANAIQTQEGFKSQKRKKSEVDDSICDILYEVFLIADHYNTNLDKEYPAVLNEIDRRRNNGEFD